jgi:ATP-binding cassette subfamily B protein
MKDMKKISAENAEAHSILNGKMIDSLSSMWIVKMFSRESFEKLTLEKEVIHTMKKTYGLVKVENKISILTFISFFIIVLGISAISLKLLFAKTITLGDFIFNINSTGVIMWDVHYLLQRFSSAIESYGRGQNALNTLIVSHTIENYTTNKINVTDGNIIIKNMSFQYKSTSPTIFKDFNLNIKSNQKVGIVGYSGAGKSTLVNLLLRFYDVTDGEIHIDGQNIKTDVTQESLRNNISYIAQDPTLFHRSIKDNILYGKLTASEDELMEVAKKSCCYDFIMSLENKFDTLVGERGVKLSGGQRQRITIARAMLKNSKILILDEATSSLDSITEKEIQIALQNLMKDKTVIVIAHRLSTLNIMDRIIVIDNGKIVEDGKREELINNNGLFRKMWDMQRDGVLVDEKE